MKGYMQPLSSIPVDVAPHHRRLPRKGFLSVTEFDCETLKEEIVAKDGTNRGMTSFASPRLIETYTQALAHYTQCEEAISEFDLMI